MHNVIYSYIIFPVSLGRELELEGILSRKNTSPSFSSLFTYTPEFPEKRKMDFSALAAKTGPFLIKAIPEQETSLIKI